jgi:lipid-binding SYLF domain-containing protein
MKGILGILCLALAAWAGENENKRLTEGATTLKEMSAAGDSGIPKELFNKSVCAIVVPGMKKGGFIVGAKYGRGFASCRTGVGKWSAPAGMKVEGGSFGLQAGGSESDIVLLVMNKSGMEKLLKSKFTLGGEASAAAGPVGRDASAMTDAMMRAEILSWSRSRGVFAGLSLQGSTMRPDEEFNKAFYGKEVTNADILQGKELAPKQSLNFVATLNQISPKQQK